MNGNTPCIDGSHASGSDHCHFFEGVFFDVPEESGFPRAGFSCKKKMLAGLVNKSSSSLKNSVG
jgi:hypothetical protein